jgi:LPPG:FO 2-phospho-L-lactate transferase
VKVTALAGGVGAGKFLRGLVRVTSPADLTVIVNTADDFTLHGLRICPDLDSVTYWLAGLADRERGWGREDESFRAVQEVGRLGGQAWFGLGDLDLATHLTRTQWLAEGVSLADTTARLCRALDVRVRVLPMTEDPVATWVESVGEGGESSSVPFQIYWVANRAAGEVKGIRFEGIERATPAQGVADAIAAADVLLFCPSNPVVSIGPILEVPGLTDAVRDRSGPAAGVSPIVGGAPVLGMADRLMPATGLEVSAYGAAAAYRGLLDGWVIDQQDASLAPRIETDLGLRVAVTDTIMSDDDAAERVARTALDVVAG